MKKMLIFVESNSNKNKYYQLELNGNSVDVEYGRVGSSPQKRSYGGGEATFRKKMNEKLRKGYVESKVDLDVDEESTDSNSNILEVAMSQIITDDDSKKLIAELVKQNIHNITSNTKIKYDINTGYFKTALGVITKDGVDEAISILDKLHVIVSSSKFKDTTRFRAYNEAYFSIVPTKITSLRDFSSLLTTSKKILEQKDICEALLNSIDIIATEKAKIKSSTNKDIVQEQLFEASVTTLNDVKEYKRLCKLFDSTKNRDHGHSAYKVSNVYKVSLGQEEKNFRSDLSNQMELFHGTKIANLLSILKSGLLMPKYSPGQTTGYMFGQGLYFADQSTKSLNYCDGMYWARGNTTNKIYMFIADIAMGNYQVPSSWRSKKPDRGYDSYWAKPGKSGIRNNEMIVFNNNQIKLKYILEITK